MNYIRRHRVTGPMLYWVDFFSPDIDKRYLKSPGLVKFGTKTVSNKSARSRHAWQKLQPWRSYDDRSGRGFRMRDGFNRVQSRLDKDERYISSYDGAYKELVVQCTDDVFARRNDAPWTRTRLKDLSPFALRVADWCAWNAKNEGVSYERRLMRRIVGTFLFLLPVSLCPAFGRGVADDERFRRARRRLGKRTRCFTGHSLTLSLGTRRYRVMRWRPGIGGLGRIVPGQGSKLGL
jgi:hypothetical protein